jgi:hypothetical protein
MYKGISKTHLLQDCMKKFNFFIYCTKTGLPLYFFSISIKVTDILVSNIRIIDETISYLDCL